MTNSASEVDWFGDETSHLTDYQDTWRLDDLDEPDVFDDDDVDVEVDDDDDDDEDDDRRD